VKKILNHLNVLEKTVEWLQELLQDLAETEPSEASLETALGVKPTSSANGSSELALAPM